MIPCRDPRCRTLFSPLRATHVYCSARCRINHWNRVHQPFVAPVEGYTGKRSLSNLQIQDIKERLFARLDSKAALAREYHVSLATIRRAVGNLPRLHRKCAWGPCRRSFVTQRSHRLYCGNACQLQARYFARKLRRRRQHVEHWRGCDHCGAAFHPAGDHPKWRFCSTACRQTHERQERAARRRELRHAA